MLRKSEANETGLPQDARHVMPRGSVIQENLTRLAAIQTRSQALQTESAIETRTVGTRTTTPPTKAEVHRPVGLLEPAVKDNKLTVTPAIADRSEGFSSVFSVLFFFFFHLVHFLPFLFLNLMFRFFVIVQFWLEFPHIPFHSIPCLHDDLHEHATRDPTTQQQGWRSDLVSPCRLDHTRGSRQDIHSTRVPGSPGRLWMARLPPQTTSDRTRPLRRLRTTLTDSDTGAGRVEL